MISSFNDGAWQENNRGLIRIEEEAEIKASQAILKPLTHPLLGQAWYKAINSAGYILNVPETDRN